ncbi:MAG: Glu/Leu/Phe/Val dehydrogenase [Hyphomicrobiales bacterium]|nr:Glu/Leu/Phe/Val dehydrogenase [Hyphomicrobiales bacterium]
MPVYTHPEFHDHEQVVHAFDAATGLRAIIAIHSTALGPAVGGCRMWPYADDAAALTDVLRLSRGMTYKSALAGLPFGGGKSVIIGDPARDKTPALFAAFGAAVDRLGGRYVAAEDVGTSVEDMDHMRRATRHVAGLAGGSGDPSPVTAYGVFMALSAAVRHRLGRDGRGRDELGGLTVAVQGLGHVGFELCRLLHGAGAGLVVADIDPGRVAEAAATFGAEGAPPDRIHAAPADVFAPCALGGILNDSTIPDLGAAIVCGAANNQLAAPGHAGAMARRGVLYVPDYLANAGGIINIHYERPRYDAAAARAHVAGIFDTTLQILDRAQVAGILPAAAADTLAEERLNAASRAAA